MSTYDIDVRTYLEPFVLLHVLSSFAPQPLLRVLVHELLQQVTAAVRHVLWDRGLAVEDAPVEQDTQRERLREGGREGREGGSRKAVIVYAY